MTGYIAGFSGLFSTGEGGTREIAGKIPGASHYASWSGTSDWKEVAQDITKRHSEGKLKRPLCIFGHSNGGYSVLKVAQTLDAQGIVVDYLGIIDLTLKPSPPVYGNVRLFQEFHAAYAKTNLHESFDGVHEYVNLDKKMGRNIGHSEAATLDFTQNKIVETITQLQKGNKPVSKPLDIKITTRTALEIAYHEGLVQEAYKDSEGVWTWSIGVTSASTHNVERYINNPATIERCIEVYIWLLDTQYAPAVRKAFAGHELTEAQFAAALSFHWNTGAIERATWVKQWLRGDHEKAHANFLAWNKPPEIIPRRRAERDLFFDEEWSSDGTVAHYQDVSGSGSPINPKRVDIKRPISSAIERHYSPQAPTIPEPPKPPVIDSLDDARASLEQYFPTLTDQNRELVLALAMVLGRPPDPPPINTQIELQPNPSFEAGFSMPQPTKGVDEVEPQGFIKSKAFFKSKRFWGLATILVGMAFPVTKPIVDMITPTVSGASPEVLTELQAQSEGFLEWVKEGIRYAGIALAAFGSWKAEHKLTLK